MCKLFKISFICLVALLVSCGGGSPELLSNPPGGEGGSSATLVDIAYLKALYTVAPVFIESEITIEGRVVSSDRQGQFYKTVCIEDGTGAIALRLDSEELFRHFRIGCTVRVNCNSLLLGSYGGLLQLGMRSANGAYDQEPLPESLIGSSIRVIDEGDSEPMPTTISLGELSQRYLSCYVRIEGVQFVEGGSALMWADPDPENPGRYTNTDRHIQDAQGRILAVRTSGYAGFAGNLLPTGSGSIRGVLSFFNDRYQLILPDRHYADMEEPRL